MLSEFHLSLKVVHFPLHPETPPEGQTLEQLFAGRGIDVAASQTQMAERVAAEGLPYGQRTMTFNSRRAQELAKWAEAAGAGKEVHNLLYQSYFVDGSNLATDETLEAIVDQLGLSFDAARQALDSKSYAAAVDADWHRCREMGITGVPAFICKGNGVVGAQPLSVLRQLVKTAGALERTIES